MTMSTRITIILADDIIKKLRNNQAKKVIKSKKSVSFSSVVNNELRKAMK